ncbi:MAG: ankyrin repeat domain-containing protein [Akkermansia sp.]|nr:ankyrin repeat domain-containing protein [Akkermansia sp.]
MKTTWVAILLGAVALSAVGCRSTLYRAAEAGDVQAVKQELEQGAKPDGKAPMANLLWQIPTSLVTIPLDMVRTVAFPTLIWPVFDPLYYYDDQGKMKYDADKYLTKGVFAFSSKTAADVAEELDRDDVLSELILAGGESSEWARAKVVSEAARKGDAETLRKLLQKGIGANWGCAGDYKPLMLAIGGGHEECARILMDNGANLYLTVTLQGQEISCYDYATAKGQVELYKKLGGSATLAPGSVANKTLSFKVTKTDNDNLVDYADSYQWANGNTRTHEKKMRDLSAEERQCAKEVGETGPWMLLNLMYTKTGHKTAKVKVYDGELRFICNEYTSMDMNLTFDNPTSGTFTADYDSFNRNGSGQMSGTFTLK